MLQSLAIAVLAMCLIHITLLYHRERAAKQDLLVRLNQQAAHTRSLEIADRSKAEFLAHISHEIRTPLKTILCQTELPLHLDDIRKSADWLMHIANDVLEFSRAEAGSLNLDRMPFSLAACIQSAIDIVQPELAAKNLSFQCRIDPELPGEVCGDPIRLRHVLFNLLDNAVKFTTCGSVVLAIAVETMTTHEVAIRATVTDTGIECRA